MEELISLRKDLVKKKIKKVDYYCPAIIHEDPKEDLIEVLDGCGSICCDCNRKQIEYLRTKDNQKKVMKEMKEFFDELNEIKRYIVNEFNKSIYAKK